MNSRLFDPVLNWGGGGGEEEWFGKAGRSHFRGSLRR